VARITEPTLSCLNSRLLDVLRANQTSGFIKSLDEAEFILILVVANVENRIP
jgi:hypothetical protein